MREELSAKRSSTLRLVTKKSLKWMPAYLTAPVVLIKKVALQRPGVEVVKSKRKVIVEQIKEKLPDKDKAEFTIVMNTIGKQLLPEGSNVYKQSLKDIKNSSHQTEDNTNKFNPMQ